RQVSPTQGGFHCFGMLRLLKETLLMALRDSQIPITQKLMFSVHMASVHGRLAEWFLSGMVYLRPVPATIASRFFRTLVLVVLFGLGTVARGASFSDREYAIDVWDAEQGLPENTPTAMVQTPDGHLWFSSFGGLVRFDGLKFKVYDHLNTPALPGE